MTERLRVRSWRNNARDWRALYQAMRDMAGEGDSSRVAQVEGDYRTLAEHDEHEAQFEAEWQLQLLSEFIMHELPGEPSRSESAVSTAIRLLREAYLDDDDPKSEPQPRYRFDPSEQAGQWESPEMGVRWLSSLDKFVIVVTGRWVSGNIGALTKKITELVHSERVDDADVTLRFDLEDE